MVRLTKEMGPAFGYFAVPTKSVLVVKPEFQAEAEILFGDLHIEIVFSSHFLGGCFGSEDGVKDYVKRKVDNWVKYVHHL